MGLLDSIRKKEKIVNKVQSYFQTLNAYSPVFTTFEGSVYEMELTRAAIHSFATHCSKLKPEVKGSGNQALARMLQYKPNALMDTKKYLYRLATSYMVDNNVIIAPLFDRSYEKIVGYYPLAMPKTKIVDIDGVKSILKVDPHDTPAMDTNIKFSIPYKNVYLFDGETEFVIEEGRK